MGTGRLRVEQIQELYFKATLTPTILAKAFEREQRRDTAVTQPPAFHTGFL